MHDHSHSHDHAHPHSHSHVHPHGHSHLHGHNAHGASQWQTPHLPEGEEAAPPSPEAQDMDLVERAFFDGFTSAPDPTSFLRLSGIPFEASDKEGARMVLLRVEQNQSTDLGSVTPTLGGEAFSYHPLPAKMISRRQGLSFVYSAGRETHSLSFEEARALKPF